MRGKERKSIILEYEKFRKTRKVIGIAMAILLVPLVLLLIKATLGDDGGQMLLWAGALLLYVAMTVTAAALTEKHAAKIAPQAVKQNTDAIHSGMLGLIWDELYCAPFDERLGGKVEYLDTYADTISFTLARGGHEFDVEVDSDGLYVIADEESDAPAEFEKKLSELSDAGEFWVVLTDFIAKHS